MHAARGSYLWVTAIFVVLALLSARAWSENEGVRRQHERQQALRVALAELRPASLAQAQSRLDRLLADARLGFRFLALRDSGGAVRATAGRFEQPAAGWLPAHVLQQLRELRYALSSEHGLLALGAEPTAPTLEYALGEPDLREWRDQSQARLARYSLLGFVLALAGLAGLIGLWRRQRVVGSSERHRVSVQAIPLREPRGNPAAVASVPRVQASAGLAVDALLLLDHLEFAVLQTDRAGLIRHASAGVRRLFGYAPEDLRGASISKLLPVPFLSRSDLRLQDYAEGGADRLAPVMAWHKDARQVAVAMTVKNLPQDAGLLVTLRVPA